MQLVGNPLLLHNTYLASQMSTNSSAPRPAWLDEVEKRLKEKKRKEARERRMEQAGDSDTEERPHECHKRHHHHHHRHHAKKDHDRSSRVGRPYRRYSSERSKAGTNLMLTSSHMSVARLRVHNLRSVEGL